MKGRLLALQIATPLLAILFGMLIASAIILVIGRNPLDVYGVMVRFSLTRTDSLFSILLKLRRGAHEVITTIMMNYIASALLLYLINDVFRDPAQIGTPRVRTPDVALSARIPSLGPLLARVGLHGSDIEKVNVLLVGGILLAVVLAYFLGRTRFGYEVRAVSFNPLAAEAAGIPNARTRFEMFMLSAAIAGMAGLNDILGFFGYLDIDFPKGLGFLGISVALLAKNNPLGVILAALLFGLLDRGAAGVQFFAQVPKETIVLLQAIIILAIVVAYELLTRYILTQL